MTGTHVTTEARDVVFTRRFEAPPALVYRAWTDPQMMAAWFGPETFTTTAVMDVRPGGAFTLTMHGAGMNGEDSGDYPIDGVFTEVVENACLVMEMRASRHPQAWHDFIRAKYLELGGLPEAYSSGPITTRITFVAQDGGTLLTVRQTFPTSALRDAHVSLGNAQGWSQSFDKLDRLLESR